jgi:uridine monophosphate synthetase
MMELADGLLEYGCVQFGEFELKSGEISPIYFDLRLIPSHPLLLRQTAHAYEALLTDLQFDRIAAIPYAAIPIATAVCLQMDRPLIYPRKEQKQHGTGRAVEGMYEPREVAVLLDDVATTGESKLEAVDKLEAAGLRVRDTVVLIERGDSARRALRERGIQLHSVWTLPALLSHWEQGKAISAREIAEVREHFKLNSNDSADDSI